MKKLSLDTCPFMTADIVGATALYYTDGRETFCEKGPWDADTPRDVYFCGAALRSFPWDADRKRALFEVPGWVGSINPGPDGTLTCNFGVMASPRFDVYNGFHRDLFDVQVSESKPNYPTDVSQLDANGNMLWQPVTPNSVATIIVGIPQLVECRYKQTIDTFSAPGRAAWGICGVGWNSKDHVSGTPGQTGQDFGMPGPGQGTNSGNSPEGDFSISAFSGVAKVYPLICANDVGPGSMVTFFRKSAPFESILHVRYLG